MAHSIELLFDPDTEAAIRRVWDALAAAEMSGRVPPGRPHVTVAVAERIDPAVDELLGAVAARLPMPCLIGAPLLFGRGRADTVVFTRLLVPSRELLDLQAEVHRVCRPHLLPQGLANSLPDQWTPHVTLARRIGTADLGQALSIAGPPAQIVGRFAALRRWDSDERADYLLG